MGFRQQTASKHLISVLPLHAESVIKHRGRISYMQPHLQFPQTLMNNIINNLSDNEKADD